MFHSNTELLIDYWRSLAVGEGAPARAEVDPGQFAALAPRAFIAAYDAGDLRFRFAGEALIDLHGRALRGQAVASLWRPICRRRLAGLIDAALTAAEPLVVAAETWTASAQQLRLEILFAPLLSSKGEVDRCLGHYQWLGGVCSEPVGELMISGAYGVLDDAPATHLRLAALDGRRIA